MQKGARRRCCNEIKEKVRRESECQRPSSGSREDAAQDLTHKLGDSEKTLKIRMTDDGPAPTAEADTVSIETETKDLRYERWSHAVHEYVSVDLFR